MFKLINSWYNKKISPYFERIRAKKIYVGLKRKELCLLELMLETGKDKFYLARLEEIQKSLKEFQNEKFYTEKTMSVNGNLRK